MEKTTKEDVQREPRYRGALIFKWRCFFWISAEAFAEAAILQPLDAPQSLPDEAEPMVIDDEQLDDLPMTFDDEPGSSFDNNTPPDPTTVPTLPM